MVRIIGYKSRQREDGTSFCILEVQGGIEMVKSKTTEQFYATAKKAYVSSTFDEETCKALIGTELSGSVQKQESDAYEYVVKETGETLILQHRFVYVPDEKPSKTPKPVIQNPVNDFEADMETFSRNGKYDAVLAD